MDGKGNFNWRFVFEFHYFPAEQSISIKRKEHFWSFDATEQLIPPVLNLQVWDNDKFSPDDFLGRINDFTRDDEKLPMVLRSGALTLDLNRLQKPVKEADLCRLEMVSEKSSDLISLFQMKRVKGWWPCVDIQDGKAKLTVSREIEVRSKRIVFAFRAKSKSNWKFSTKKRPKNGRQDVEERNRTKIRHSNLLSKFPNEEKWKFDLCLKDVRQLRSSGSRRPS